MTALRSRLLFPFDPAAWVRNAISCEHAWSTALNNESTVRSPEIVPGRDGSTIQTGIGQIPDATLKALVNKRDLGVWTEMFSDGVLDLVEAGVINGKYKTIHPNKISASFTLGSKRLYDFINRNPAFTFHPSDLINDPIRISRQHKMVAINSALEVDLTGQVCADSIGTRFYSGIGGQVDFIRGASMCPGGKPIIALPSTAKKGELSRIAATLTEVGCGGFRG